MNTQHVIGYRGAALIALCLGADTNDHLRQNRHRSHLCDSHADDHRHVSFPA